MLSVPPSDAKRGPLDIFSAPVGLDSIVEPWFTDWGAAWSLLCFSAVDIAAVSEVLRLEVGIWSQMCCLLGLLWLPMLKSHWERGFT